eukprot:15452482-Alexandrium_andersonii.AAC.1
MGGSQLGRHPPETFLFTHVRRADPRVDAIVPRARVGKEGTLSLFEQRPCRDNGCHATPLEFSAEEVVAA